MSSWLKHNDLAMTMQTQWGQCIFVVPQHIIIAKHQLCGDKGEPKCIIWVITFKCLPTKRSILYISCGRWISWDQNLLWPIMGFKADSLHCNKCNFVFWEMKLKPWDLDIYWGAIAAQCIFNFTYPKIISLKELPGRKTSLWEYCFKYFFLAATKQL